jgi:hypothetical protein
LPQFIEEFYFKRFGKTSPEAVLSIEQRCRLQAAKKEERRTPGCAPWNGDNP